MNEEIEFIVDAAKEQMQNAIDHFIYELTHIRAGKASPNMLRSVKVEYYGASTPLTQVANVNTLDAHTLTVQPFEKSLIQEIEKGIMAANLGLNPMNNGESVIINIPILTEERRKELVKQAKGEGENAKISIRNDRKDANNELKKLDVSEDALKNAETDVQDLTNTFIQKVDEIFAKKEKEIMTV